jgi:hypothetical protein
MRQPDLFRKTPTGQQLKAEALDSFEHHESNWMARARARMVALFEDRRELFGKYAEVSSDDVWDLCPPPADCHPSVMGPVFRGGLFVKTGWRASKRPSAHARMISTYRLKE